jgi:DNA-binding NarL/FixJ family response regulator
MAVVGRIRVLVLDQREVVRLGLAAMLAALPEVALVGAVGAVGVVGADEGGEVDVVIASPELSTGAPSGPRRLVVVGGWDPAEVEAAVATRPDGYLAVRDLTADALRAAVAGVVAGDLPPPEPVASHLLDAARGRAGPTTAPRLTPREDDVLELLVAGHSNQEIASRLGISIHGARRHVAGILGKFGSPSRSHLVSRVLQARSANN